MNIDNHTIKANDDLTLAVAEAIDAAGYAWLDANEGRMFSDAVGTWYAGWADVPTEVFAQAAIKAYEEAKGEER